MYLKEELDSGEQCFFSSRDFSRFFGSVLTSQDPLYSPLFSLTQNNENKGLFEAFAI